QDGNLKVSTEFAGYGTEDHFGDLKVTTAGVLEAGKFEAKFGKAGKSLRAGQSPNQIGVVVFALSAHHDANVKYGSLKMRTNLDVTYGAGASLKWGRIDKPTGSMHGFEMTAADGWGFGISVWLSATTPSASSGGSHHF